MLTGGVIGLIVGVVMVIATAVKQKQGGKAVVAALAHGPDAARRELDTYVKPPVAGKKTELTRLQQLLERFAWLGILGAYDDLEREAELVNGATSLVAQLRAQAATSLLAHRTEARDLQLLLRTNELIHTEGGALLKLVKNAIADVTTMAGVLDGKPFDITVARRIYERADKSGPAMKIAQLRFLARMAEVANVSSSNFRAKADEAYGKLAPR